MAWTRTSRRRASVAGRGKDLGWLNLAALLSEGCKIKLCYEASYVGYCLHRDLIANGVHGDIVSPSSISSPRGKAIKTDRIDAGYLAQFYANDLLPVARSLPYICVRSNEP